MHFGRFIQEHSRPEWREAGRYVNYSLLKTLIDAVDEAGPRGSPEARRAAKAFRDALDTELQRVLDFYASRLREATGLAESAALAVSAAEHDLEEGGPRAGAPPPGTPRSGPSARALTARQRAIARTRIAVEETTHLLRYVALNMTAVRKILKKFAKHSEPEPPRAGYLVLEVGHPTDESYRVVQGTRIPESSARELAGMERHLELLAVADALTALVERLDDEDESEAEDEVGAGARAEGDGGPPGAARPSAAPFAGLGPVAAANAALARSHGEGVAATHLSPFEAGPYARQAPPTAAVDDDGESAGAPSAVREFREARAQWAERAAGDSAPPPLLAPAAHAHLHADLGDLDLALEDLQSAAEGADREAYYVHAAAWIERAAGMFEPPPEPEAAVATRMGLAIHATSTALFMANYTAVLPVLHAVCLRVGVAPSYAGQIMAASDAAAMVTSVGMSYWSNTSIKNPVLFGAASCLLGNVLFVLAYARGSLAILLAARALNGLGSARTVNRRYNADFVPGPERTAACAVFVGASTLGMAAGPAMSIPLVAIVPALGPFWNPVTGVGWVLALSWAAFFAWCQLGFDDPPRDATPIGLVGRKESVIDNAASFAAGAAPHELDEAASPRADGGAEGALAEGAGAGAGRGGRSKATGEGLAEPLLGREASPAVRGRALAGADDRTPTTRSPSLASELSSLRSRPILDPATLSSLASIAVHEGRRRKGKDKDGTVEVATTGFPSPSTAIGSGAAAAAAAAAGVVPSTPGRKTRRPASKKAARRREAARRQRALATVAPTLACALFLLVQKSAQQGYLDGVSLLCGGWFGWHSTQSAVFLATLCLLLAPVNLGVGALSRRASDATMVLGSLAIMLASLGGLAISGRDAPVRFFASGLLLMAGTVALEGAATSLMSKVMWPGLARGVFNAGLLSTEAGTAGRFAGNALLFLAGTITGTETPTQLGSFSVALSLSLAGAVVLALLIFGLTRVKLYGGR